MKKTIIITLIVVLLTSVALIAFVRITSAKDPATFNLAEVKRGSFEIAVSSAGELVAERSVDVRGPNIVQNSNFRMAPIKITDIVPEGTFVKKGEYIATLDRTSFNNTFKDETDNLRKLRSEFEMKIFDTAVVLTTLRDDIRNQYYAMEEAEIVLEQSKYEPPAIQRQALLEFEKAQRYLDYKKRLYHLRYRQTSAEVRNLKSTLDNQQSKVKDLGELLAGFTVTAPADGMVIYKKDRTGIKRKAGSMISPFDPVVATLPDLSSMLSKIYVSEIDVNKVRTGQAVQLTVDAFREKTYTGYVTSIANIGEQFSNSDSKVFEVLVKIEGSDLLLRPSMTTSNKVITRSFNNVVYVPVESVHAGTDSIPYVYTEKETKQVVVLGEANEKNIIIEEGLPEGGSVWLMIPDRYDRFKLTGNDLIPVIRERAKARKLELDKERTSNKILTELVTDKETDGGSLRGI